jgi:hypothetical protein
VTAQQSELEELTEVVRELSLQVDILIKRLTIDRRTVRRLRLLSWFTVAVASLSIIGVIITGVLYFQVRDAVNGNKQAAVAGCQNANEARNGNLVLWQVILQANQKTQTPKQRKQAKLFSDWINKLYAAHDCNHLNKKYPIPPPPKFD